MVELFCFVCCVQFAYAANTLEEGEMNYIFEIAGLLYLYESQAHPCRTIF